MIRQVTILFTIALLFLAQSRALTGPTDTTKIGAADSTTTKEWDVAAPHGPAKDIEFDTDE